MKNIRLQKDTNDQWHVFKRRKEFLNNINMFLLSTQSEMINVKVKDHGEI